MRHKGRVLLIDIKGSLFEISFGKGKIYNYYSVNYNIRL
jgi:hypothetical protein